MVSSRKFEHEAHIEDYDYETQDERLQYCRKLLCSLMFINNTSVIWKSGKTCININSRKQAEDFLHERDPNSRRRTFSVNKNGARLYRTGNYAVKKRRAASKMNQANVSRLVSKLRYKHQAKPRRLSNPEGPVGRVRKIQKTLTALLKFERIELNYNRGDEVRGYAERLISEAIRHGPAHEETMKMADYWIIHKQYVHKLFKVLAPRYENYTTAYTKLHRAPPEYGTCMPKRSVLELRGNPYPSIEQNNPHEPILLHNILLDEARKEFRLTKYEELAENLTANAEANKPPTEEKKNDEAPANVV